MTTEELIRKIKNTNDLDARQQLAINLMPFAHFLANKYIQTNPQLTDTILSDAYNGLWKGINCVHEKFTYGQITTFVGSRVLGEIRENLFKVEPKTLSIDQQSDKDPEKDSYEVSSKHDYTGIIVKEFQERLKTISYQHAIILDLLLQDYDKVEIGRVLHLSVERVRQLILEIRAKVKYCLYGQ
jgi:RNA polymerase sigma factor (sigma-70 family)